MTVTAQANPEIMLAEEISQFYADPLGFVVFAYPWGEPGTALEKYDGPDDVQAEFLNALGEEVAERGFDGLQAVLPIRMAESSGHGTGKTALGAWVADWILSTRPFSKGTVTAGTYKQLEERTWAAIKYWTKLCVTSHWFEIQEDKVYRRGHKESWYVMAQSCKQENAQSFAGQHAIDSTSWYLFDEASEVPDKIWETAEGGLTDGEPMIIAWGQLVRNTGEFYRVCQGDKLARWNHRRVDSRKSKFTNKALIEQWIKDYGEESDFVKVRVFGLPPSADELQYIDRGRVEQAAQRIQVGLPSDPIIAGFDVSGGGKAWNVIRFRQGLCGTPPGLTPWRLAGEKDADRSARIGKCAELLRDERPGFRIAMLFIDSAFGAPIAYALKSLGFGSRVMEINFGGESPDLHCLNMRAFMWMSAKDWLRNGSIKNDFAEPSTNSLCHQLTLPGYHVNNSGKLVIESKQSIAERGESSPDDADSFVLTFAQPVYVPKAKPVSRPPRHVSAWS